ncbi:MAG TPA: helix-turn-helix transcriptional regulator [Polyangiaceae bacterium]|nr:helix-turn-helix transcriptional regulator [Polyangiaceae bacterium]
MNNRLFPALLRFWRSRRGLSQLDLALEAEISTRHLSFLESGRAQPGETMVLRLLSTLQVPLRAQNEVLQAAGFEPRFVEPAFEAISPEIEQALAQMMNQQEPFPLIVLGGDFTIVRSNRAAGAVFGAFLAEPALMPQQPDMFSLVFDPRLLRSAVLDWETVARGMLGRLQRELLQRGDDARLEALLARTLALPDVPASWKHVDLARAPEPIQRVHLTRGEHSVRFVIAVTTFAAPCQVTLEELRVEACFPLDAATTRTCERLAQRCGC